MALSRLLLGVVLLSAAHFVTADDPEASLEGVTDLTPKNFDSIVDGSKHVLVEFYAPWCGHCKHLVPVLSSLGKSIQSDPKLKNRVVIAKVNADEHRDLGGRFGVSGFPTLKWFGRGKPTDAPEDYASGRTLDAFSSWITQKLDSDTTFARVESLDSLVRDYLGAGSDVASSAASKLEEAAGALTGEAKSYGELYVKVLKRGLEKGKDYYQTEADRLERLIRGGKTSPSKMKEILSKLSVLSAFRSDDTSAEE